MEHQVKNEERFTDEVYNILDNVNDRVTSQLQEDTLTLTIKMDMSEFLNGTYDNDFLKDNDVQSIEQYLNDIDRFGFTQNIPWELKKCITDWSIIPKEVK